MIYDNKSYVKLLILKLTGFADLEAEIFFLSGIFQNIFLRNTILVNLDNI